MDMPEPISWELPVNFDYLNAGVKPPSVEFEFRQTSWESLSS